MPFFNRTKRRKTPPSPSPEELRITNSINLPYTFPIASHSASSVNIVHSEPLIKPAYQFATSPRLGSAQHSRAFKQSQGLYATADPSQANHIYNDTGLCRAVSEKLCDVITCIDDGTFNGREADLAVVYNPPATRGEDDKDRVHQLGDKKATNKSRPTSSNYFSKVYLYANSTLSPRLQPVKFYLATYPLFCLAAQYSRCAYEKPAGAGRQARIEPDWRSGTKAMVINSVPIDDMNTIIFAIRGSQSFRDWAVNLKTEPTPPTDFLDDPGNLCHSGFLSVARKTVDPVAARLKELLRENPNRSSCSLLITGHSSGGAVASLLYCHMLSQSVQSELTHLRGSFKRVHCITFGAPPVSLLPLEKPSSFKYRKSIFFSFINEGDPVCRADKAYVRSLLELYISPGPGSPVTHLTSVLPRSFSSTTLNLLDVGRKEAQKEKAPQRHWSVPVSTLSNAGRLVVLRNPIGKNVKSHQYPQEVEACATTDAELRGVVFGDPMMHSMDLYAQRIEVLATNAVTAKFSMR